MARARPPHGFTPPTSWLPPPISWLGPAHPMACTWATGHCLEDPRTYAVALGLYAFAAVAFPIICYIPKFTWKSYSVLYATPVPWKATHEGCSTSVTCLHRGLPDGPGDLWRQRLLLLLFLFPAGSGRSLVIAQQALRHQTPPHTSSNMHLLGCPSQKTSRCLLCGFWSLFLNGVQNLYKY